MEKSARKSANEEKKHNVEKAETEQTWKTMMTGEDTNPKEKQI
jgi:hypothetical protein